MRTITKLWIFLTVLVVLSPLGLAMPLYFKSGAAWGEWDAQELKELIGYIPEGVARLSSIWHAALPDYAFRNHSSNPLFLQSIVYMASAAIGILITSLVIYMICNFLIKKRKNRDV